MSASAAEAITHPLHPAHPLYLKSSVYRGEYGCDGCGTDGSGPVYHCEPCRFDLHPRCAARGGKRIGEAPSSPRAAEKPEVINHPLHNHPLTKLPTVYKGSYICNGCRQKGSGEVYHCTPCQFDLHPACATTANSSLNDVLKADWITHPSHPHNLKKLAKVYANGRYGCDGCKQSGEGFVFHCDLCNFDLHPKCAAKGGVALQGDGGAAKPVLSIPAANIKFSRQTDNVQISGLTVSYPTRGTVGLVQANTRALDLPAFNEKFKYFEVEILSLGSKGSVVVGLATINQLKTKLPGWTEDSIAWHGDDGHIFWRGGHLDSIEPFKKGDVIGVGIDMETEPAQLVFTRNGEEMLAVDVPQSINIHSMIPSVGFYSSGEKAKINFEPSAMKYRPDAEEAEHKAPVVSERRASTRGKVAEAAAPTVSTLEKSLQKSTFSCLLSSKPANVEFVTVPACCDGNGQKVFPTSWTDWNMDVLQKSLKTVFGACGEFSSKEDVLTGSTLALWLLMNCHFCKHDDENLFWNDFNKLLDQVDQSLVPKKTPGKDKLDQMKKALNDAFKDIQKDELKDTIEQTSVGDQIDMEEAVMVYNKRAAELKDLFDQKLKKVDPKAQSNVKSVERAIEKASADYNGNAAKVLDYLRGLVHVQVDIGDSAEKVLKRYQRAKGGLPGKVLRVKCFNHETLPRVLINCELEGFVCEVQIHFRFKGFDDEFYHKKHILYELSRKPMRRINEKDHVLDLALDLCERSFVKIDRKDLSGGVQKVTLLPNGDEYQLMITKRKQVITRGYKIIETEDEDGNLAGYGLAQTLESVNDK